MALTTMVVLKKDAAEGNFTLVAANPVVAVANKVYAATADMEFENDEETELWVDNQGVAGTLITFVLPARTYEGVSFAATGQAFTVPPDSLVCFGPLAKGTYDNAYGKVVFTVSVLTTVFMWAKSIRK